MLKKKPLIDVSGASMIDLKAELVAKQAKFRQQKGDGALQAEVDAARIRSAAAAGSDDDWLAVNSRKLRKKRKEQQKQLELEQQQQQQQQRNAGVAARDARDRALTAAEQHTLARSAAKLQEKAALYSALQQRPGQAWADDAAAAAGDDDDESDGRYLIDFERKALEGRERHDVRSREQALLEAANIRAASPPSDRAGAGERSRRSTDVGEEWVEFTDAFGRERRCKRKDLPQMLEMDKDFRPTEPPAAAAHRPPPPGASTGANTVPLGFRRAGAGAAGGGGGAAAAAAEPGAGPEQWNSGMEMLSQDMRTDIERRQWEREALENVDRAVRPEHYQTVLADEIRDMGTAYFRFSTDEDERHKQMKQLEQLRDETQAQRVKRERLKRRREDALQARLQKIKQRRKGAAAAAGETGDDEQPSADSAASAATGAPVPSTPASSTPAPPSPTSSTPATAPAAALEESVDDFLSTLRRQAASGS